MVVAPEEMCSRNVKSAKKVGEHAQINKRRLLAGQEIIIGMEEEQHAKKMKLLDLQILREEAKISMDKEYHDARMILIAKQSQQIIQHVEIFENENGLLDS